MHSLSQPSLVCLPFNRRRHQLWLCIILWIAGQPSFGNLVDSLCRYGSPLTLWIPLSSRKPLVLAETLGIRILSLWNSRDIPHLNLETSKSTVYPLFRACSTSKLVHYRAAASLLSESKIITPRPSSRVVLSTTYSTTRSNHRQLSYLLPSLSFRSVFDNNTCDATIPSSRSLPRSLSILLSTDCQPYSQDDHTIDLRLSRTACLFHLRFDFLLYSPTISILSPKLNFSDKS